jgi:hypothetical protein
MMIFFQIDGMKYLLSLFSAILLFSCGTSLPTVKRTAAARQSVAPVWSGSLRSDTLKNSYRLVLKYNDKAISGLCFLKKSDEGWRGTLVNDMGAKAFDFVVTDDRCELRDIIPMMDKWYIRRAIADDLYFLVNADNTKASFAALLERFEQNDEQIVNYGKKQIRVGADGSVTLINSSRGLRYELRKMTEIDNNKLLL